MTYRIRPVVPSDFYTFFSIARVSEPGFSLDIDEFWDEMHKRQGFAVLHGEETIGSVMFSNLRPGKTVVIHCTIKSEHHGRWARPVLLRSIAQYAYGQLGVEEIIGYGTEGANDKALAFLEHAGFKPIRVMKVFSLHRDQCRFRQGGRHG